MQPAQLAGELTGSHHAYVLSLLGIDPRTYESGGDGGGGDTDCVPEVEDLPEPLSQVNRKDTPKPPAGAPVAQPAAAGASPAAPLHAPVPAAAAPPSNPEDVKKAVASLRDFNARYKAIPDPNINYEIVAALIKFIAARKLFVAAYNAKDYAAAVAATPPVDAALKGMEAVQAELPKLQKKSADTVAKIDKMTDDAIGKLKSAEKASLVRDLLAGGAPTGAARATQRRLYRDTDLDPAFRKGDKDRRGKVAAALKGDKDLEKARDTWNKATPDEIVKALKKVVAAQSKVYGIEPPEIVTFEKPGDANGVEEGFFNPADGKLHINVHADSSIHDFADALDTALHENMHNYQNQLVEQLQSGKLKPGDPAYDQAQLFAANALVPGGYVEPDEDKKTYEKQPMERHSWEAGAATSKAVLKGL